MSISRSQKFVYFQNKATHYHKLRNAKSSIDHSPPRTHIPKPKLYRPIPFLKQQQIQMENDQLIDRLVKIAGSQRIEVGADGSYSRYNKLPFRIQKERAITIDNSDRKLRMFHAKPAIGTNKLWNKEYYKSICDKKNMSKYFEDNKLKNELHFSANKFIPQHLKDYGLRDNLNSSVRGQQNTIPIEKLFQLPQISKKSNKTKYDTQLKRMKSDGNIQASH